MTAGTWICGDCRSVNSAKQVRCYRCRVPRATGEMPEATAAISRAEAIEKTTVLARATRLGARYRASWPLTIVAIPLILISTALDIAQTRATMALIDGDGAFINNPALIERFVEITLLWVVVFVSAVVTWSFWIALVVGNVPALIAQWPSRSPIGAFFAAFIPFVNLKRPQSVVSEVVVLLGGDVLAAILVWAWWACFLAAFFVSGLVVTIRQLTGGPGTVLDTIYLGSQIRLVFLVPAAILAITVIVVVERIQRQTLRRRDTTVLSLG